MLKNYINIDDSSSGGAKVKDLAFINLMVGDWLAVVGENGEVAHILEVVVRGPDPVVLHVVDSKTTDRRWKLLGTMVGEGDAGRFMSERVVVSAQVPCCLYFAERQPDGKYVGGQVGITDFNQLIGTRRFRTFPLTPLT